MPKTSRDARFDLGFVYVDPQVSRLLSSADVEALVRRHVRGDWGRVDARQKQENERFSKIVGRARKYREAASIHVLKNVKVVVRTGLDSKSRATLVSLLSHRTAR